MPEEVAVYCPLCGWETEYFPEEDRPNGLLFAYLAAASVYRDHFDDEHRPLPVKKIRSQIDTTEVVRLGPSDEGED
jgi:hypothetical protein